jgi:hypothetical protein
VKECDGKELKMPVTHFDIDDQWNPDNIEEARKEAEMWWGDKKSKHHAYVIMDTFDNIPCDFEDEAVEVNRNYGG